MHFRKFNGAIVGYVMLFAVVMGPSWAQGTNPSSPPASGQSLAAQQKNPETLLMNAQHFRLLALYDIAIALQRTASDDASKRVQELGSKTWPAPVRKLGWPHFMGESLLVVSDIQDDKALSAFYHPWSDVFLVLRWVWGHGAWKIDDADWVVGDWLRQVGQGPINLQPAWLRGNAQRSGALALEIAQSVKAFEDLFVNQYPAAEWREVLNLQPSAPATQLNQQAAAVQLNAALMNQANFNRPDSANAAALQPIRAIEGKVVQALHEGRMADLLAQATKTEPLHRQALARIHPAALDAMFPVFYIPANQEKKSRAVVFLSSEHHADFAIAMHLSAKNDRVEVFELIPFAAVVDAGAEVKEP